MTQSVVLYGLQRSDERGEAFGILPEANGRDACGSVLQWFAEVRGVDAAQRVNRKRERLGDGAEGRQAKWCAVSLFRWCFIHRAARDEMGAAVLCGTGFGQRMR